MTGEKAKRQPWCAHYKAYDQKLMQRVSVSAVIVRLISLFCVCVSECVILYSLDVQSHMAAKYKMFPFYFTYHLAVKI